MDPKMCQKCGERPATEIWAEGAISYVHGVYLRWCKRCVVETQLMAAETAAETIPALRAQLATL
jgi:hypothetical protein